MLRPADLGPLAGVAPVAGPEAALQRALQGWVGRSLQAEVLARLSDGGALVRVAGMAARLALPAAFAPGAQVSMTLAALQPRPAFRLDGDAPAAALLYAAAQAEPPAGGGGLAPHALSPHASTPNAWAPHTLAPGHPAAAMAGGAPPPAGAPSEPGADAPAPDLSAAARAIAGVLGSAHSATAPLPSLIGAAPLLAAAPERAPAASGAPPDPAQLARTLQQAVSQSGLFYESHVAEWADGQRSLAELQREPQMRPGYACGAEHADAAAASAQWINLQLTTHERARVLWQGELWPGQPMQWRIEKDAPGRGARDDGQAEAGPLWRSGMRFRFPRLGEVSATLVLSGGQLHIDLRGGDDGSVGALRGGADALRHTLAAAGAPLATLSIGPHADGTDADADPAARADRPDGL